MPQVQHAREVIGARSSFECVWSIEARQRSPEIEPDSAGFVVDVHKDIQQQLEELCVFGFVRRALVSSHRISHERGPHEVGEVCSAFL